MSKHNLERYIHFILTIGLALILSSCYFHLQGEAPLASGLHQLYLETNDPYGTLTRDLQQRFKMSHVQLVDSPQDAKIHLVVITDDATQDLLSVSSTQLTRQYSLRITISVKLTSDQGVIILAPQTFTENRIITVQSSQTLGSSNEATLTYQQLRRSLANAIMNRLSSRQVTELVNEFMATQHKKAKS
jgi:LPS-assembly lipoprotein